MTTDRLLSLRGNPASLRIAPRGPAVGPQFSIERRLQLTIDLGRPANGVADEEVEVAVAVVIEPAAARPPLAVAPGDAGRIGYVFELAVIVAKQPVWPDGREENI